MKTTQPRKKILVVDDDQAILEVLQIILEDDGYEVILDSKVSYVQSLQNVSYPDLILLDMSLSGKDGKEICKNLKSNDQSKHIPVIILSAHADIEQSAKECGADDFLPKPFDIAQLIAIVHKHLDK